MRKSDVLALGRRYGRAALKILGYVIACAAGLAIVGGLVWGVFRTGARLAGGSTVVETSTPTCTPIPTRTPTPTRAPTRTPRPTRTPTPTPTPARYPDLSRPEERSKLYEDFLAAWTWFSAPDVPQNIADLPLYFAPVPDGVSDPAFKPARWAATLDSARSDLEAQASIGAMTRVVLTGGQWMVVLLRHGDDNSWAVVRGRYTGGHCRVETINTATGELVLSTDSRCMRYVAGMVYDLADGRWKIANMLQLAPETVPEVKP